MSATVLERPTYECAARGCVNTLDDDVYLERISPKGGPFVGLCQHCLDKSVILKEMP